MSLSSCAGCSGLGLQRLLRVVPAICAIESWVATVDLGRLPLACVPSASLPISRTDPRAVGVGATLTAFSCFRVWLHKQRDPSFVSCIDFMLALYGRSATAKEVLLHSIGCHGALMGRWVSLGMIKGYNEEHALLKGVCVG